MGKKIFQFLIGIALIVLFFFLLYFLVSSAFRVLASLDHPIFVGILAASATVLAATITVVVGRLLERKREIESHFRQRKFDQYDELLKLLYSFFGQDAQAAPNDDVVKQLMEWQRKLILFSSPKTIQAYAAWMTNVKNQDLTIRTLMLMETFFKALRADLGISNFGLRDGDFTHLFLRHAHLYAALMSKSPDMKLSELSDIEKALDANASAAKQPTNELSPT